MKLRILAAAILILCACPEPRPPASEETLPDQIVEDFVVHETSSGVRLYTLAAERAFVYDREQRSAVVRPRVTFYEEGRTVNAVLTADSGAVYSRTEDLVARGNVRVQTADSTVLLTDSLAWSSAQRVVRTDAAVEISTPNGVLRGVGLVSDAGLQKIEILSEVRGTSSYDFGP